MDWEPHPPSRGAAIPSLRATSFGRGQGGGDWDRTGHTLLTTEVTPPGHGGGWPRTAACVAPPAAPGCPIAGHQPAAAQSPATQVLERGTFGDGYVRHRGGALSAR